MPNLPAEILRKIIDLAADDELATDSKRASELRCWSCCRLLHFCERIALVNSTFHEISKDFLLRHLALSERTLRSNPRGIMAALTSNPARLSRVASITTQWVPEPGTTRRVVFHDDDLVRLFSMVPNARVVVVRWAPTPAWLRTPTTPDVFGAMGAFNRVEELTLSHEESDMGGWHAAKAHHALDAISSLPSLRRLRLEDCDTYETPATLIPTPSSPPTYRLTSLVVVGPTYRGPLCPSVFERLAQGSVGTLRYLELSVNATPAALASLVKAVSHTLVGLEIIPHPHQRGSVLDAINVAGTTFPRLKTFVYSSAADLESLVALKAPLESLRLQLRKEDVDSGRAFSPQALIEAVSSFAGLQYLEASPIDYGVGEDESWDEGEDQREWGSAQEETKAYQEVWDQFRRASSVERMPAPLRSLSVGLMEPRRFEHV